MVNHTSIPPQIHSARIELSWIVNYLGPDQPWGFLIPPDYCKSSLQDKLFKAPGCSNPRDGKQKNNDSTSFIYHRDVATVQTTRVRRTFKGVAAIWPWEKYYLHILYMFKSTCCHMDIMIQIGLDFCNRNCMNPLDRGIARFWWNYDFLSLCPPQT